jgi:hypothetical protein
MKNKIPWKMRLQEWWARKTHRTDPGSRRSAELSEQDLDHLGSLHKRSH